MYARRFCVLLVSAALALAACSSSGGKSGPPSTAADAAQLGQLIKSAVDSVSSAHFVLNIGLAGQSLSGQGDEKLSGGKLDALDVTVNLPSGAGGVRLIVARGKTYAKLPASMNTSGKPYLLVTANSSNAVVRQFAPSLDAALEAASIDSVSTFVAAAKSVKRDGSATVNGISTTHYSIVVDIKKLPTSLPGRDTLLSSGRSTLPVELYLDDRNRPVRFAENFKVAGQSVSTKLDVSDYNQPVTIKAPPASQVGS